MRHMPLGVKMNQQEFDYLLTDFTSEVLSYDVTDYEKRYFWKHFQSLSDNLKLDLSAAWELADMIQYDPVEIRRFRNVMATQGTELTIRQAEIWLVMLEIVLISVGFYEWEQA